MQRLIMLSLLAFTACSSKPPSTAKQSAQATPELWVFKTPESDAELATGSTDRYCGDEAATKARELTLSELDTNQCETYEGLRRCRFLEGVALFRDGTTDRPWAIVFTARALVEAAATAQEAKISEFVKAARAKPCEG